MSIRAHFNAGPDYHEVQVGSVTLYFSFNTCIAFDDHRPGFPKRTVARDNVWGSKTGKHINASDGGSKEAKARRLTGEDFQRELDELVRRKF